MSEVTGTEDDGEGYVDPDAEPIDDDDPDVDDDE